jgi:hypothetical protein
MAGKNSTGGAELIAFIGRLVRAWPMAALAALKAEAEIEMAESQERVPVDTGLLRASGYVAEPEAHGSILSVELGYGGAASDYAVIVHEDLDAIHPHGEAKYLEGPLVESEPYLAARIGRRLHVDTVAQ